ncbi:MAG: GTPase [Nanoarchaeota archaeon]
MPINAGYEYFNAEKRYLDAQTLDEKITALEEMIKVAPKHKGSENLLAELKTRLKKFREKSERVKKSGGGKKGIKKEGYQVVLAGLTNSGKSALLAALTNARPLVSPHLYTTLEPALGTMDYEGVKAQVVDQPSIGNGAFDVGLVNNANCVLEVVEKLEDIIEVEKALVRSSARKIVVFNKIDLFSESERRKIEERCKSRRFDYALVSAVSGEGISDLKRRIFLGMGVIRVYMKEPGKVATTIPAVLPTGSSVKDVGEGIFHGFTRTVKETRVTGPSAKFANQKVGLAHVLKDKDIVEFHTQ